MDIRPIDANALCEGRVCNDPVRIAAICADTLSLNTLRDEIYEDAVAHGLWEPGALLLKQAKGDEKMASLALGVTLILGEAQEFVEAIDDPKKMEEELADIAIMCFSFAGRMGIDIDAAICRKMEINKQRPWKHQGEKK